MRLGPGNSLQFGFADNIGTELLESTGAGQGV